MNFRAVNSFEDIVSILAKERGLKLLGKNDDEASNTLYAFTDSVQPNKSHILKLLEKESLEVKFYKEHILAIRQKYTFGLLELPEALEIFTTENKAYLLVPHYNGDKFTFNTPDINLAKTMPLIVKDLLAINVEEIKEGGSNYDFEGHEREFWTFFKKAVELGLINPTEEEKLKVQIEGIFIQGRNTQKMIISNGDFNPRNIIRLSNGKLVLIDWDGVVLPLEQHLAYAWLLNFENPAWQKTYAETFEQELPIQKFNVRYHLMRLSLIRAVGEMGHYKPGINENPLIMVKDHMKNFHRSLAGFDSLTQF